MNEEKVYKEPGEKIPEVIASVQSLECSVSYLSEAISDLAKKLIPVRGGATDPDGGKVASVEYSAPIAERIRGTQMCIDNLSAAVRRVRDEVEL